MMRRGLTLEESVDKTKIQDFVQTDVLRGDFQQNFSLMEIDFIVLNLGINCKYLLQALSQDR